MKLKTQKRLAAKLLGFGKSKVIFDEAELSDIKEAITRGDLRRLIKKGIISKSRKQWQSRSRARKKAVQKGKGRQKGHGSRKGRKTARTPQKRSWMIRIRLQRGFISELKEKGLITPKICQMLRTKAKGGFFRNKRHIKIFLDEHNLIKKDKKEPNLIKKDLIKKDKKEPNLIEKDLIEKDSQSADEGKQSDNKQLSANNKQSFNNKK